MTASPSGGGQVLRIGTRGSALALAQAKLVLDRFRIQYPERPAALQVIRTEGDVDRVSPLTEIGGRGVFTNAIEAAILRGEVDAAVHSAKDLPSILHADVPIVAFPERDDPRDVLVSRHGTPLDALPANPCVGTSSRRREAQIRHLRPDARTQSIRGNVDTRLRKAESEEFDGVVLAAAGLRRMGWNDSISEVFAAERMVPSPGQGALAIQAKLGSEAAVLLRALDDPMVSGAVEIERSFLREIGAGCTYPVGALANAAREGWRFIAMLADASGERVAFADALLLPGDEMRQVAEIAARMKSDVGMEPASRSWVGWSNGHPALSGLRIVVTRPRRQAGPLLDALAARGAEAISLPTIRVEPVADTTELDGALDEARSGLIDWLVFTSVNAVDVTVRRLAALGISAGQLDVRVATVGPASADAARGAGFTVALTPRRATADDLLLALRGQVLPGERVLYPRSAIGRNVVPDGLRQLGAHVIVVDAYQTVPERDIDPSALERVGRGDFDGMVFFSPSSVRNLIKMIDDHVIDALRGRPAFCLGPVTAQAAEEFGFEVAAIGDDPGEAAIVEAIASNWRGQDRVRQAPAGRGSLMVAGRSGA